MSCLLCELPLRIRSSWKRFLFGEERAVLCEKCEATIQYSVQPYAIFTYNASMKSILKHYKFSKDIRYARFFAAALKKKLKTLHYDVILPIPMHPLMKKQRTFCHMEVVFEAANLPFEQLIEKTTTAQQSKKSKRERERVAPLFRLIKHIDLSGKTVVIVDDLLTTGTTLKHAEKLLLSLGAKKIEKIVLISGNN